MLGRKLSCTLVFFFVLFSFLSWLSPGLSPLALPSPQPSTLWPARHSVASGEQRKPENHSPNPAHFRSFSPSFTPLWVLERVNIFSWDSLLGTTSSTCFPPCVWSGRGLPSGYPQMTSRGLQGVLPASVLLALRGQNENSSSMFTISKAHLQISSVL